MKRFLIRVALFATIMIAVDTGVGAVLKALTKSAIGGDTARNEYIANEVDADILIFGSSRAIHHYDPKIFEEILGMSCYNCGQDGMGIVLNYPRYTMIAERYRPKIIIYEVLGFDISEGDNHAYLTWLRPYYDKTIVAEVFADIDETERWKMKSKMYAYNGKALQIIGDNIVTIREEENGYRPLYGVMDYEPKQDVSNRKPVYDTLKIQYLEKLIVDCKKNGTKLIFAESPFYKGTENIEEVYAPLVKLCKKYDVAFLNYYNDPEISIEKEYFEDSYHLNHRGAEEYSRKIATEVKKYCGKYQ